MTTTIVVVYTLNDEYPTLSAKTPRQIEYWIREGCLNLGNVYDGLPSSETYIVNPVGVTVIKEGETN